MVGETIWLNQITDLFLTTKQNVGQHIRTLTADNQTSLAGNSQTAEPLAAE